MATWVWLGVTTAWQVASAAETVGEPEGHEAQMASSPVGKIAFKPGKGLQIESEDGRFALNSRWRVQIRYDLEQTAGEDGGLAQAFQIRRARWTWTGHFFGEDNTFKLDLNLSPGDVALEDGAVTQGPLRDVYVEFRQLSDMYVTVGQQKIPFSRQFIASSGDLMLVDRSIVHSEFSLDRDLGVKLSSPDVAETGHLGYAVGVFTGEGPYTSEDPDFGMLYAARIDLRTAPFREYQESDQERSATPRAGLGLAFGYLDEGKNDRGITGSPPSDGGTTDTLNATADFALRASGVSVDAAFHWREGNRNRGDLVDEDGNRLPTAPPRDGIGLMVQTGWLLPHSQLEPSVRYSLVHPTSETSALTTLDEADIGLSYYFAEHVFKIQGDLSRRWTDGDQSTAGHEARVQLQASI